MAKTMSQAARYFPEGKRGLCSYVRAAGYSNIPPDEHMSTSNQEVLTVIHIEGEAAASGVKTIVEIPGIDVIFLGPWDLSQSLGVPGKTKDPKVIGVMETVIRLAKRRRSSSGTFVREIEDAKRWIDLGVQYMMVVHRCRSAFERQQGMGWLFAENDSGRVRTEGCMGLGVRGRSAGMRILKIAVFIFLLGLPGTGFSGEQPGSPDVEIALQRLRWRLAGRQRWPREPWG